MLLDLAWLDDHIGRTDLYLVRAACDDALADAFYRAERHVAATSDPSAAFLDA